MIYLQSNDERTLPHHFDVCSALYGSIEECQNYRLTTFDEVSQGKFDQLIKGNLFVGSVEFMREVFNRIGITDVRVPKNSNRSSEIKLLGDVKNDVGVFIKPLEIKLFTGFVLDGCHHSILDTIPNDTKVLVYEPFKEQLLSEWRVYIHRNKIEDSHCYSGDFKVCPNYEFVEEVISDNVKLSFPNTYVIDVGVLESGENVVVEYNDMWAIGNYGVPNWLYLKMLKTRYFDIVK
jgi:hypothetical protein